MFVPHRTAALHRQQLFGAEYALCVEKDRNWLAQDAGKVDIAGVGLLLLERSACWAGPRLASGNLDVGRDPPILRSKGTVPKLRRAVCGAHLLSL